MIERRTGDRRGRSFSLESLPTGSVVYVGRGSFRMETVEFGDDGAQGIVQAAPIVTTSPYGIEAREEASVVVDLNVDLDRAVSCASWRAPALESLFGSQDEVTMLVAPTGQASLPPAPPALQLSRAALASVVALVFMGGLATASLTLQPRVIAARPVAATSPVIVHTPTPFKAEVEPIGQLAALETKPAVARPSTEPSAEPATIQVAAPVKIRVQKKVPQAVAAVSAPPASVALETAAPKWVDPFAD